MRTSKNPGNAKFAECLTGEVRRILIPRTPVNRGQESKEGPVTQRKQVGCPTTVAYPSLILVILPAGPLQDVRVSSVSPSDLGSFAVGAFCQTPLTSQLFRGFERAGNRRRTSGV